MLELRLAPHFEAQADPSAPDYDRLQKALKNPPLYHQWRTYQAKDMQLIVNSYNTGTGKTKAALLRLLDLSRDFSLANRKRSNVLFIAPTNELLRQHEKDVRDFVKDNDLEHLVLRLDSAEIKRLGVEYLPGKFVRQHDRLDKMLSNPASVLLDEDGYHPEGHKPHVIITNPDIFYYALYGLGNPHDRRMLFRDFVEDFGYIIIDEFHYYNSKQLANFLFFLTLCRQWNYFNEGRQVCLLTATPMNEVRRYLGNLNVPVEYIEPGKEPPGLPRIPALAPLELRLVSQETSSGEYGAADGLVKLAGEARSAVEQWLKEGREGAFISSALWRINRLYELYGGSTNPATGRLIGPQSQATRQTDLSKPLLMATPTVDIGYNFDRPSKRRQSLDFLLFDARTWDEFIQRLGRAARVLGKAEWDNPSIAWAVVPDELVTDMSDLAGQEVERAEFNRRVKEVLPAKNGLYAYIKSGAIGEAFLPIYHFNSSLSSKVEAQAEELYAAVCQVYETAKGISYMYLANNIRRYLKLTPQIKELEKEAAAPSFEFGLASVYAARLYNNKDYDLSELDEVDEITVAHDRSMLLAKSQRIEKARLVQVKTLEEYFTMKARFSFRDNFQAPQVLIHDFNRLLTGDEYSVYSALHLIQNYEGEWSNDTQRLDDWTGRSLERPDAQFNLTFDLHQTRNKRLRIYFYLNQTGQTRQEWEDTYLSNLVARRGFEIRSDDGPVPAQINPLIKEMYLVLYAVPERGPEARTLHSLSKLTTLYTSRLKVDFKDETIIEYEIVVGSAALQVSCESKLRNTKFMAQKTAARHSHLFDWE